MSDNYEQAKALGITDEELGIAQPDLAQHAPELAEQRAAREAAKKAAAAARNSYPIPAGTEERLIPAFRTIPQNKVLDYKKLYDGFVNKDMPFVEFCVEMAIVTNPALIQRDLSRVIDDKHTRQSCEIRNRIIINTALNS